MPTVVLWGPPCSGKSTHIRENSAPGDIVVDLDRLALAFAVEGTPHHDYPDHVRELARAARAAIVDDVAAWGTRSPHTAWIIDSNASDAARARWRRIGASVVKLNVPYAECVRRAQAERPASTLALIDEWFTRHGA